MSVPAISKGQSALESVRTAFEIMAAGAPAIADSMLKVATEGKSEIARVQAAAVVFDRIGLPAKVDVGVTAVHLVGNAGDGPQVESPASQIKKRLASLRSQLVVEGEVVDAEVIELFPQEDQE